MDYPEHPATTHRRAVALVAQVRSGDQETQAVVFSEVGDPIIAGGTIVSLCQLVNRVLDEFAPDPEGWLQTAMLELAAVEGQDPPADPNQL